MTDSRKIRTAKGSDKARPPAIVAAPSPVAPAGTPSGSSAALPETIEPYRTERTTKQGLVMAVSIVSTALLNEAGEMYAIATTERTLGGDK